MLKNKNKEGLLPTQEEGYYKEYTVDTPGLSGRGEKRIVTGKNGETYYTEDHYQSFQEVNKNVK